ncbi:hypothetical protein [Streptomyces synnematoformans]|uniref:ATP/GTP-binding protein n=1 Tax=Streptomyces synnematoformans TaxID=415721 RepID=A0ABP5J2N5_9ACTN
MLKSRATKCTGSYTVMLFVAGLAVSTDAWPARADGVSDLYGGLTCAPGACEVEARSVKREPGRPGKSGPVSRGGTSKPGSGGEKATGPPTVTSTGWDYELGGVGILPRFDGGKAEKPARGGRQRVPVETVVQRAVERLELPEPVIRTSPDEDLAQVVHVPTWLWVEHSTWGPVSTSAAVEGVKVRATARPRWAVWSMGEGGRVVCRGPGTPYSEVYSPRASSPDCGYTYRRASVSGPDRAYTVSVRVTWDVHWQGAGEAGVVPGLVMGSRRDLVVDEVQSVVVR